MLVKTTNMKSHKISMDCKLTTPSERTLLGYLIGKHLRRNSITRTSSDDSVFADLVTGVMDMPSQPEMEVLLGGCWLDYMACVRAYQKIESFDRLDTQVLVRSSRDDANSEITISLTTYAGEKELLIGCTIVIPWELTGGIL